jgi:hypothetical protein
VLPRGSGIDPSAGGTAAGRRTSSACHASHDRSCGGLAGTIARRTVR